jgi:hypothetical protein
VTESFSDSFAQAARVQETFHLQSAKLIIDRLSLDGIDELIDYAMNKAADLEFLRLTHDERTKG